MLSIPYQRSNTLLTAATDYPLYRRWAILPLHSPRDGRCDCGKADCSSPAKHPRTQHGLRDASADPDVAWATWERWPSANIGVLTGSASGIVVLDEDGAEGAAALAMLEGRHGPLAETLTARTGRGRHFYFSYAGTDIRNSAGRLGPKLDVRGEGGYIVAPPSEHITGTFYTWETPILPVAPLPEWLRLLMLTTPSTKPTAMARQIIATSSDAHGVLVRRARIYVAAAEGIGEGGRNGACFRLAGHLASFVGEGGEALAEGEIVDLLADFSRRCTPPLPENELVTAVRSALKNGAAREPKPPQVLSRRARTAMRFATEGVNV